MLVAGVVVLVLLAAAGLWVMWAHTHDVIVYAPSTRSTEVLTSTKRPGNVADMSTEDSREWQDGFVYVIDDDGTESWQRKNFPETP
jgi:hypothetical protein